MDGIESLFIEGPYEDPITGRTFTPDETGVLELHASQLLLQGTSLKHLRGVRVHDGRNTVDEEIPSGNELVLLNESTERSQHLHLSELLGNRR